MNHQPPPRKTHYLPAAVIIAGILIFFAFAASFTDPNLNFPVVSQIACSVKGDTWYGGGILGAPGCYAPQGSTP